MASAKPAIEEVSGFLGVGSLEILGIFFILDGTSGFLTFVEAYSKTSTWAILVTVPLLVVAYVFGIISSLGVQAVLERFFATELTPTLFRAVSESKKRGHKEEKRGQVSHGTCARTVIAFFHIEASQGKYDG